MFLIYDGLVKKKKTVTESMPLGYEEFKTMCNVLVSSQLLLHY